MSIRPARHVEIFVTIISNYTEKNDLKKNKNQKILIKSIRISVISTRLLVDLIRKFSG